LAIKTWGSDMFVAMGVMEDSVTVVGVVAAGETTCEDLDSEEDEKPALSFRHAGTLKNRNTHKKIKMDMRFMTHP
jgi:hypothetical protein